MKKLFTLIIIASLALTIQAQDNIVNTLGPAGKYKVDKSDGTNILNLDYTGDLYLGGTSGPYNARMLNLVKEGSSTGITLTTYKNGNPARSRMNFSMANGTIASPTALVDNDVVSFLDFFGHDGGDFRLGASINVNVDGSVVNPGTMPMEFDFQTNQGGVLTSKLKIRADGKVGIGETSPTSTLDVNGSVTLAYTTGGTTNLDDTHYTYGTENGATVTLPTAVGIEGRVYIIKLITSGGTATVNTTSTQKIDAITTYALSAQWDYVKVQSTGAAWIIIGQN